MHVAETNLVRCRECEKVYIYADLVMPPRAGYKPCPNCSAYRSLISMCTTTDAPGRVFFKRVTDSTVEVEKLPGKDSTRVSLADLDVPLHLVGGPNAHFEVHIHPRQDA